MISLNNITPNLPQQHTYHQGFYILSLLHLKYKGNDQERDERVLMQKGFNLSKS